MTSPDLIYGRHAVLAALKARPGDIREIWIQNGESVSPTDPLVVQAREARVSIQRVNAATLRRRVGDAAHQGVAARARPASPKEDLDGLLERDLEFARLLVLDGVTDPRNLGACLRVAEAAGVRAVIAPARRQARLASGAFKSASGSAERVPLLRVSNLARSLERIKRAGVWLYAAAADSGTDLWRTTFRLPWAMVVGGEGRGLRARTRALCDFSVSIPMRGEVESLNVATASSVLLFEADRQSREGKER